MVVIECTEINQVYAELMTAFQDCNKIKNSDLRKLVELVLAVNTCANGGASYNTLVNFVYEPDETTVITYEPNTFHSISLVVTQGNIIYNGITLPTNTSINLEFTTLNQHAFTFTIAPGSKVLVEYIIEDI